MSGIDGGKQKERTVHQRKHEVDQLIVFPYWEDADMISTEKMVGEYRCLHTGMQRIIDRAGYPESSLYDTHKIQAGGDPAILPRHRVHPGCVMGG